MHVDINNMHMLLTSYACRNLNLSSWIVIFFKYLCCHRLEEYGHLGVFSNVLLTLFRPFLNGPFGNKMLSILSLYQQIAQAQQLQHIPVYQTANFSLAFCFRFWKNSNMNPCPCRKTHRCFSHMFPFTFIFVQTFLFYKNPFLSKFQTILNFFP